MNVKIMTKEKLDSNAYNRIVIRKVKDTFNVKVSGNVDLTGFLGDEYSSTSYKLSDSFKDVSSCEKILSIVESFLASTEINCIELSEKLVGYAGTFIKISGIRELYLQIDNKDLIKKIVKMVKDKYEHDRYNYCICNNDCNSYCIRLSNKCSSYEKQFINCENCDGCEINSENCPKHIEFKLMYNGKILPFDKNFLQRFIYDKLWEIGLNAQVIETFHDIKLADGTLVNRLVDGYCIICGDMTIKFNCSVSSSEYIVDICNEIVNRYNGELSDIENAKKRQLKMEGF